MKKRSTQFFYLAIAVLLLQSCDGSDPDPDVPEVIVPQVPVQLVSPLNEDQFTIGEPVEVEIKVNNPAAVSELELFVNDTLFAGDLKSENQTITIQTNAQSLVGWTKIFLSYKDEKGQLHGDNRKIVFFSAIFPVEKRAEILKTYPHAKTSYTQGLEFYKGTLFEGTGQYNQSILAEVDLESGTKLRQHNLLGSIFGEGITVLNDTIYQITYKAQICYMYDMQFNPIGSFTYSGEGWGLCNNGKDLIMSNGSNEIVWRNPRTFEVVKTLQVFDDETSVERLNELELINGKLLANLYTDDRLAEIDTATGAVLSYIDCRALVMDATDFGNDVLNGIAHNPINGKIYMTGKWWSKLYEVSIK